MAPLVLELVVVELDEEDEEDEEELPVVELELVGELVELLDELVELPVVDEPDPEVEVEVELEGAVDVVLVSDGRGVEIVGVLEELLEELEELLELELDDELELQTGGRSAVACAVVGTRTPASANAWITSTTVASDGTETGWPSNVTVQPVSADATGSAARPITKSAPSAVSSSDRNRRLTAVPFLGPSSLVRTP
ncbi:MAG: hypothetical protein ACRDMJ_15095 [Solirubrobacteraceae bacterium]